ncbi:potassium channel subfamily K member 10 isoform X2 [Thalassophryne amazonica]|uniref:potassium channel subfamily K member 10 isoform X2 n=1 Tax=Thalassophryne amazonica TaxID=390379 RepID=UPI0014716A03|nr:potassium channel subfamily K member 10 isoform X2 [Thalassophryne amazonica]
MRSTTLLALLMGVMLYLGMGAFVFSTLEDSQESEAHKKLLAAKRSFLNHSCVSELDFNTFLEEVMSAVDAGVDVTSISPDFTSRWNMDSAFFFCGTIITTIGFGNLSPRTWYGQLFFVCYALMGIPMFGILLAGVGDYMGRVLRRAVAKIETLFLKHKVRPTTVRVISAVLSILIGCLIFLAVPAVVFQKVEDWTFLESLYFVVVTLTTVGFGDFVPGMVYKPLVLLWIVFGLAYFASILTMIDNWLRVLSKRTRAEIEELRAHATDWTQNIQNMSKDFRIPNPLEFNDPFLLQRRRWKRSERRHIRRGAHGTLGYWVHGGPENGHLPNHWAGLSSSLSQIEVHASLERSVVSQRRPRVRATGGATVPRVGPGLKVDSNLALQVEGKSFPYPLPRSFSLPVTRSASELDSPGAAMQGGSLSGSESSFDSRSGVSSASSSYSDFHRLQRCLAADRNYAADKQIPVKESGVGEDHSQNCTPSPGFLPLPSPHTSLHPVLVVTPPVSAVSSSGCQLLDFFGENLAYIDESSDALSDRVQKAAKEDKRQRPRKPKRSSMRRQLSHKWSPLRVRKQTSDMLPPSNPPTPPPTSHSKNETNEASTL